MKSDPTTDAAPLTQGCLDLGVIETIASGQEPDPAQRSHLDSCPACRALLEDSIANAKLLLRLGTAIGARPAADAAAAPPADLVPGYRILEEISRGSQGVVYRAVQERTRRTVALKMLLGGAFATEKQRARFEREVEIIASLKHPGIVTVYDGTPVRGGRYAYAMEHIDGGVPLDQWRPDAQGNLEQPLDAKAGLHARLALFASICDAVHYAHQRGVIHRDLKPGNILVDRAGTPHILDFGIATATGGAALHAATLTVQFAGTIAYASPEQIDGPRENIDVRTDVYSLGVILFEMLAGRLPHDINGCSITEAARRVTQEEPAHLGTIDRSLRGDLDTIAVKALEREPARRYQSAAALASDIGRYLAGQAIEARRSSGWYVLRKMAARHRVLLAGAAVVALAIVFGAGAAGYGIMEARNARGYEAVERARSESAARSARSAARFIRQMFVPADAVSDVAALGRYVYAGRVRALMILKLGALSHDPDEEATARSMFASEILKREELPEAEVSMRIAISSLCREHGEEHPALAEAFHELADILLQRGNRLTEAERYVGRAIEIRSALFRGDDPALAASRHLLARVLLKRGEVAGAGDACEEAAANLRSAGRPYAPELAAALATRSEIRRTLGRAAEAEADAREALVLGLEVVPDDDDPFVVECLLRNADLLRAESDRPPDPSLAAALQTSTRAGVADALCRAAGGLRTHGTSASDCLAHAAGLETVLALRTSLFGKDHASISRTAASIAADHHLASDVPGSEAALRRLLPLLEARLGPDHLALVSVCELLNLSLMTQADYDGAAAVRRRIIEIWNAQPEPARDDMWIANEHRWLAFTLALGGSFEQAQVEYQACIDGLSRAGLADHYLSDICTSGLGWAALHLGRPGEAESLCRAALDRFSARTGVPADQKALLQRNLAHVLIARGGLDEAAPLIEAAHAGAIGDFSLLDCTLVDAIELARRKGDIAAVERLSAERADARRWVAVPHDL